MHRVLRKDPYLRLYITFTKTATKILSTTTMALFDFDGKQAAS